MLLRTPAVRIIKLALSLSLSRIRSSTIARSRRLSSPLEILREIPLCPPEFGIRTQYLPAKEIKEVKEAPLLPRDSFSAWTKMICPFLITSWILYWLYRFSFNGLDFPASSSFSEVSSSDSISSVSPSNDRRSSSEFAASGFLLASAISF